MTYLRHIASLMLTAGSILVFGCAGATHQETVDEYIAETGLSFSTCGDFQIGPGCAQSTEQSDSIQCFLDAFAACEAKRLDITEKSFDGDLIEITYLVIPKANECSITRLTDSRSRTGNVGRGEESCTSPVRAEGCPGIQMSCFSACSSDTDCG